MSAVRTLDETLSQRRMIPADASACAALSRAVGWLHREEDWSFVIALGDGIVIERGGDIVATALSWSFGETHASFGMIIVAPALQGVGIGKRLMAQLLAQTEGRSQMLTATEAGRPLYEKVGFAACGSVCQHQGIVQGIATSELDEADEIRRAVLADLDVLCRLDFAATGLARRPILAALLGLGEAVVLERHGAIVGFGMIRGFGRGEVIGPVVAPDERGARSLIAHWLGEREGRFVRIDFGGEDELSGWVESFGLAKVDEGVAMVRGEVPVPAGLSRRFALVNQALG